MNFQRSTTDHTALNTINAIPRTNANVPNDTYGIMERA